MPDDIDIYRSARLLIKQHGRDAQIEAAMRAADLLDKGDPYGYALWRRIRRAVGELRRTNPGARVH